MFLLSSSVGIFKIQLPSATWKIKTDISCCSWRVLLQKVVIEHINMGLKSPVITEEERAVAFPLIYFWVQGPESSWIIY